MISWQPSGIQYVPVDRDVLLSLCHRMFELGGDPWRSPGWTSQLQWGHVELIPRTMSTWVLNIFKDGDSTGCFDSLCHCWVTLTMMKYFLMFRGNLQYFSVWPSPLVLALGTAEKSLALSIQVFLDIFKIPLSPLFPWLESPTSPHRR